MIPLALAGKDIVARAPTGSGKTIAYALPVLQKVLSRQDSASLTSEAISALVLVPTRELCQQALGVLGSLLGHAGAGHVRVLQLATPTDAALLRTGAPPDVLIATPSQLLAHLRASKQSGRSLSSLATLVLDEADLLLSYGYGDDIAAIGAFLPQTVHTLLLSATITPDLDGITALLLHNPTTLDCADDAAASGKLRQFYLRCSHADKFLCAGPPHTAAAAGFDHFVCTMRADVCALICCAFESRRVHFSISVNAICCNAKAPLSCDSFCSHSCLLESRC
eukprot:6176741-Pleurochrysis_carterae.AAC.1